jgi:DedD protein
MGLFSSFQRSRTRQTSQAAPFDDAGVAAIRLRARRRLLGAIVLVLAAVIGLPLVLETQPRPVASDISIDVRRDTPAVPAASTENPLALARPLVNTPTDATAEPAAAQAALTGAPGSARPAASPAIARPAASRPGPAALSNPAAPAVQAAPTPPVNMSPVTIAPVNPVRTVPAENRPVAPPRAPATPPAPQAAPAAPPKAADAQRAQALLEAKPAGAAAGQFVLQLGAFEQAAAARETRGKAEKLGYKVFEQTIDAGGGARRIRVRIGPFGNRDEAERMLHKLQASGLTASVMPL